VRAGAARSPGSQRRDPGPAGVCDFGGGGEGSFLQIQCGSEAVAGSGHAGGGDVREASAADAEEGLLGGVGGGVQMSLELGVW